MDRRYSVTYIVQETESPTVGVYVEQYTQERVFSSEFLDHLETLHANRVNHLNFFITVLAVNIL